MSVKIFIDSRESGDVFSAFRRAASDPALIKTLKENVEIVEKGNMESGDFVCGEYAVEHKTPSDYRQSVITNTLLKSVMIKIVCLRWSLFN